MDIMATMWNSETQQVEHGVSSFLRTPPASSQSDNERNIYGDNQPTVAATQNVEEAHPASSDNVQVQVPNYQKPIRRRYSHHTQHQKKEMERFFKGFPYPDEKQRRELGNMLGLNSSQIKFWFQNKHTYMKAIMERNKNNLSIANNKKLRVENLKYKGALSNATCLGCEGQPFVGGMSFEEKQLRLENDRLKEDTEIQGGTFFSNLPPPPHTPMFVVESIPQSRVEFHVHGGNDPQRSIILTPFNEYEKASIVELAVQAMEELKKMAHDGVPLWIPGMQTEILNRQEYVMNFPSGLRPRPLGFRSEATTQSMIVNMNPNDLIEILMDVNQWSTMFANIVSTTRITEILSIGGVRRYDGALQAMSAEFQVLSHLVSTRDSYFLRYSKHHPNGAWVVDISLDYIRPGVDTRWKRRPSGCMIQEIPNGFSKVTWIEHVDVEDREVHDLFKPLVNSDFAYAARRSIITLERQCERLAYTMTTNIPSWDISGITLEGRNSLTKLAEKIMQIYCNHVGASPLADVWTIETKSTGVDDVRVMTRNHTNSSGTQIGLVFSATTSFSLPVPSKRLFDFLRNMNSRNQWDIFTNGFLVQQMAYIENGRDPGNFVSILLANSANNSERNKIIVQEICTDSTSSYVVYSPVEHGTMNLISSGSNSYYGTLLPSSFAILPNGIGLSSEPIIDVAFGGCLGTISYQMLFETTRIPLAPDI